MKEDLHSWFQGVSYEKAFGPSEVPSSEQRNKLIDTYVIVSAIDRTERMDIFLRM